MRMTIDEAIKEMEFEFNLFLGGSDLTTPDLINYMRESNKDFDKVYTANSMALDILRKYQKIEEIMAKRPKDMISSNPTLRAISEVLKDAGMGLLK